MNTLQRKFKPPTETPREQWKDRLAVLKTRLGEDAANHLTSPLIYLQCADEKPIFIGGYSPCKIAFAFSHG